MQTEKERYRDKRERIDREKESNFDDHAFVRAYRTWQHAIKRNEISLNQSLWQNKAEKKNSKLLTHSIRMSLLNRETGLLTFLIYIVEAPVNFC